MLFEKATNLGVLFDITLSMEYFLNPKCKATRYHDVGNVPQYRTRQSWDKPMQAFVTSNLDYCNSLLLEVNT